MKKATLTTYDNNSEYCRVTINYKKVNSLNKRVLLLTSYYDELYTLRGQRVTYSLSI